MQDLVMEKRRELIEVVSEVDDQLAEAFLSDEPISADELKVYLTCVHYYYWCLPLMCDYIISCKHAIPPPIMATSFKTDVGM
jgi:hypothetical protein